MPRLHSESSRPYPGRSVFQRTAARSLTRLRPAIFVNRPVRTRMRVEDPVLAGVVWGPGEKNLRLPDWAVVG